jgi:hypothetical protein
LFGSKTFFSPLLMSRSSFTTGFSHTAQVGYNFNDSTGPLFKSILRNLVSPLSRIN